MALKYPLQELKSKGKHFKIGDRAAFAKGWHPMHMQYENVPGIIIELGSSVVRIRYADGEVYGPSPENAYLIQDYKTNKQASLLLSQED